MTREEKMDTIKKFPAFMKAYFPSDSSQRLKLCSSFTSFLKISLPDKVFLKNRNGKIWVVEVSKIGNELFFQAGWSQFLEENCVEFADLLVFQYNGGHEFDCKILGKAADNREISRAFDFSSKEGQEGEYTQEVEEMVEETTNSNSGGGRQEELDEGSSKTKRDSGSSEHTGELRGSCSSVSKTNVSVGRPIKGKSKAVLSIDDSDDNESRVDGLKNPCFVVKVNEKRTNEVYIPKGLVKIYGVKRHQTMIILDPAGNKWSTKVTQWKDGRIMMVGGWKSLFRRNHMHNKDCFLCELVQGEDPCGAFIKVHTHYKNDCCIKRT